MRRRLQLWITLSLLLMSVSVQAEQKGTKPVVPVRPTPTKTPVITKPTEPVDPNFSSVKLNNFLGIKIVQGSALTIGSELGFALWQGTPFYIGPEASFSLYPGGNLTNVLAGSWYEARIYGSPRLSVIIGALGGVGMAKNVGALNGTNLAAYIDMAIAQDVDDLVTVRGQIRPGIEGKYFAFMMNFDVCFRF